MPVFRPSSVALANGSSGRDLITFADGLQGTITLGSSQLIWSDSVDIVDHGAITISGNDQSRIFYAATANTSITLEGLTLTNGHAFDSGGAIYSFLGTLHVAQANFRFIPRKALLAQKTQRPFVGASNRNPQATKHETLPFQGNARFRSLSLFRPRRWVMEAALRSIPIKRPKVRRYHIGSICVLTRVKRVRIDMTADLASCCRSSLMLSLRLGVFSSFQTSALHALSCQGSQLVFRDVVIENCVIAGNSASLSDGYGGGIYAVYCYNVGVTDLIIEGNEAKYGGDLLLHTNVQNTMEGTIITGNEAYQGGGIYTSHITSESQLSRTNDITITNSQITNNTASNHSGGAVFHYSENVTIEDSIISGNSSTGSAIGGLYFFSTGNSVISGSRIENNRAAIYGGGVVANRATSGAFASLPNEVAIIETMIANNLAGTHGGGIYMANSSSVQLENSLLSGNSSGRGGAIYSFLGTLHVSNSRFEGNTAASAGGAIWRRGDEGQHSVIADSFFESNHVTDPDNYGGAIYFSDVSQEHVSIRNTAFRDNIAHLGGAICAPNSGSIMIESSLLAGNLAHNKGGGIYACQFQLR